MQQNSDLAHTRTQPMWLPNSPSTDTVSNSQSFVNVSCVDSCSQTIAGFVGTVNHFTDVLELQDLHHRPKDLKQQPSIQFNTNFHHNIINLYLLLGNAHIILHLRKHSWLHEIAFVTVTFAATFQLGSLLLARINEPKDLVKLIFINLWALLNIRVKRIADFALFGTGYTLLDKLVVYRFFHKGSGTGTATLALVEEQSKVCLLNSIVH